MPGTISLPGSIERLCVGVGACLLIFGRTVYNSALACISCLPRALGSAKGENLGLSQIFSGPVQPSGHLYNLTHAFSLDSQKYIKALLCVLRIYYFPAFP